MNRILPNYMLAGLEPETKIFMLKGCGTQYISVSKTGEVKKLNGTMWATILPNEEIPESGISQ